MFNIPPYATNYQKYKECEYVTLDTIIDQSHNFNDLCDRLERNGTPFDKLNSEERGYILAIFAGDIEKILREENDE